MLIDDRIAIIGSANINDRSMRGSRDSEIAALFECKEEHMVPSKMNGYEFKVNPFVYNLRLRLWRDYLGVPNPSLLADPVHPHTYIHIWKEIAARNTEIYYRVFPLLPEKFRKKSDLKVGEDPIPVDPHLMKDVRGFLMDLPLTFLADEPHMTPTVFDKEFVVPHKLFQ